MTVHEILHKDTSPENTPGPSKPALPNNDWQQLGVKILPAHGVSMLNRQSLHGDSLRGLRDATK